ncbi:MAG: aspartate aminotransferase family protein [Balneolales bacterium]|nr:aspartate aminotransferase family protein [Balneolales bacterium]
MYKQLIPLLERWFEQAELQGMTIPARYHAGGQAGDAADTELQAVFEAFIARMQACYPFHQPAYAGQMLKPPHPAAWLAYAVAMSVNTNNHALDGGPETSQMEKEVIRDLAGMVGYDPGASLGHLTSGGTVANLEALWVARCLHPDKPVLFSEQAHYTHSRMCSVLGMEGRAVSMDLSSKEGEARFREALQGAGTLVVTLGTTGTGTIEPLDKVLPLCRQAGVRIHVDAAYGGFFTLLKNSGLFNPAPFEALWEADSIVIDPHKHGLQPYGCGCVLFRDASVGRFYKHDSPYTYFSSDELHLGEITLECSRAGAAAAALWFTIQLLGLHAESRFAGTLKNCLLAARSFASELQNSEAFGLLAQPETDIVCYFPLAGDISEISRLSRDIFHDTMQQGQQSLFLSLYKVNAGAFVKQFPAVSCTDPSEQVTILRSVFMKPEHLGFIPEMMRRLRASLQRITAQ